MPELLGFKEKNGKILAVVRFPNARKFVLTPDNSGQNQTLSADQKNNHEGHKK